uniref:Oxidation resistance protein 1 n=1 Tax=Oryza meridionalis TaxID=40149 RepID=A0A0E0CRM5_9ORYZ
MHASVGRRWGFDPCDEVTHVVMNDFALMNDHIVLLQGHDKSRISPAGYLTRSGPTQGGGIRNNIGYCDGRSINESCGKRSTYPQTYKKDVTVPKSTKPSIFDADEYVSVSNVSDVPSSEGNTMQDEHRNKGKDLLYCDWSELLNLDDLEADLSCLLDNTNLSTVSNESTTKSILSSVSVSDTTSAEPLFLDQNNMANPINIQQPPSKGRSSATLNHEALACSSGEIERFSQHSDVDVFYPFDNVTSSERISGCEGLEAIFCTNQEMLAPTTSSIMCDDEIVSSSTFSAPDLVATYVPRSMKRSHDPLNGTPDMILDEMAGNPLEMYFPPSLTAYEHPEHLNNVTLTQTHQFPEGFAGDDVLKSADLQFLSKGKTSADLCVNPCSPLILEAVPVKDLGFHKLQEGMNQLDVASKARIRDALYRLANCVEDRHRNASTTETHYLCVRHRTAGEAKRGEEKAQILASSCLQPPPPSSSPPRTAGRGIPNPGSFREADDLALTRVPLPRARARSSPPKLSGRAGRGGALPPEIGGWVARRMGYLPSSLGSKAAHFVSDLTTVILNPISEREPSSPLPEVDKDEEKSEDDKDSEQNSDTPDGPDTSSFRAFLISFLSSSGSSNGSMEIIPDQNGELGYPTLTPMGKSKKGKSGLLSRGKHSIGKIISKAARIGGFKQNVEPKIDREVVDHVESVSPVLELAESKEVASLINLPAMSEPSVLLSEVMRSNIYASFPVLAKGMNWVLLYSTWRHGISLSTLYRRSMLCPGYSLLVVGDKEGAVFGGLVEAPLQPTSAKKYQGSNSCFVFTNLHSNPSIYRPTGANNYFTVCSTDYLALGGGGHFALYLDADLLSGSSSNSETFNNMCLSHSPDFAVKDVELWGFVYPSKYEETLALCRTEKPGICRW